MRSVPNLLRTSYNEYTDMKITIKMNHRPPTRADVYKQID